MHEMLEWRGSNIPGQYPPFGELLLHRGDDEEHLGPSRRETDSTDDREARKVVWFTMWILLP